MGQTCLHFAFCLGYTDLGEYLISKGANETLRNTYVTIAIIVYTPASQSCSFLMSSPSILRYGLTCRQGLAPGNLLTSRGPAASSAPSSVAAVAAAAGEQRFARGYATERRSSAHQQQQQQHHHHHQENHSASGQHSNIQLHSHAFQSRVCLPPPSNFRCDF